MPIHHPLGLKEHPLEDAGIYFYVYTSWKFNIDPEIFPCQKESSLPTHHFSEVISSFEGL